jgi:hypothetical protein
VVKTTAVVKLYSKGENQDGQVALNFNADYTDARNQEWAKYTPALSMIMHVIEPVAETFTVGKNYLLTFEEQ